MRAPGGRGKPSRDLAKLGARPKATVAPRVGPRVGRRSSPASGVAPGGGDSGADPGGNPGADLPLAFRSPRLVPGPRTRPLRPAKGGRMIRDDRELEQAQAKVLVCQSLLANARQTLPPAA